MLIKRRTLDAIIAAQGDWHASDTVGLCPPEGFQLADGGWYKPGRQQLQLWQAHVWFWDCVKKRKKETGAPVYAILDGDLGDINTHDGLQLVTRYKPRIHRLLVACIAPVVEVADYIFIVRGTEAHSGGLGELEEWLAKDTDKVQPDPETGNYSWWVLEAEIGGLLVNATHHPKAVSRIPNKQDQSAARHAERVALEAHKFGESKPDICYCGHVHYAAKGTELEVWAYYTPPMKWVGAYGHRLGSGMHAEPVGGILHEVRDGQILNHGKPSFYTRSLKRRKPWTAS